MGVITGQFQGTLEVPIYVAPYSVTVPANASAAIGHLNPWSDNPLMGEMFGINNSVAGYTALSLVINGYAAALSYSGSAKITVNGGYDPSAPVTQSTPLASLFKNRVTFGNAWCVGQNLPGQPNANYLAFCEISQGMMFGTDINYPTPVPNNPFRNGVNTDSNVVPRIFSYGGGYTALPCILYDIVNDPFTHIPITAFLMLAGSGNFCLAVVAPDYADTINPLDLNTGYPLLTGQAVGNYNNAWNLPLFTGVFPRNKLWGVNSVGSTINCMQWRSGLQGANSGIFIESIDTFVFDDPALNAVLSSQGANSTCTPCGLRGWLFSDTVHGADYWVSATGLKYWKLNYLPQGNAKPVPSGSQANYKFVDFNGIFWYTGSATQAGNVVTPQNSLGFSIPYSRISLPAVPPMHIPCYDDCLGQGANITKRI